MQFVGQQLVIITGQPPFNINPEHRITRSIIRNAKPKVRNLSPLDQALRYAQVLNEPSIVSKNQADQMTTFDRLLKDASRKAPLI
ncbi:MAG: hypothetical protein HQL22_07350 [Candidatus Omnitrophica bacterium]|nr:hypothetical protein [Candidatus Omnitrophota bacterium]